jgi:hypothetical protein
LLAQQFKKAEMGTSTRSGGVSWTILFVEQYFLPIFLAGTLALCAGAVTLWVTVHDLTSQVRTNTDDIKAIQTDMSAIRANSITRSELLEILKRVEQQLEIMTLKAKVAEKIKLTN